MAGKTKVSKKTTVKRKRTTVKTKFFQYNKILLIALIIIFTFNVLTLMQTNSNINKKATIVEEAAKPANLKITKIISSSCTDCFDIVQVIDFIKQTNNVQIEEEIIEYSSEQAKELIEKYEIKKIPALIIQGEIDKTEDLSTILSQLGELKEENTILFTQIIPVYIDVETNQEKGRISIINIIDESCEECYNVSIHKNILISTYRIVIDSEKTYDVNSEQGSQLIEKYNITKIPTIILSEDAGEYSALVQVWPSVGSVENDGSYVFTDDTFMKTSGGYRDLVTNEIIKSSS